jgi:hypothetical protein
VRRRILKRSFALQQQLLEALVRGKGIDYGGGPAASKSAKKSSKDRRRPKRRALGDGGRNSSKDMFGQLSLAPLGDSLTLAVFVAPSTVVLRRVFPTTVCEKMFGEELGPGNEPCGGWNQPVLLKTPSLEPPVGDKGNSTSGRSLSPSSPPTSLGCTSWMVVA